MSSLKRSTLRNMAKIQMEKYKIPHPNKHLFQCQYKEYAADRIKSVQRGN